MALLLSQALLTKVQGTNLCGAGICSSVSQMSVHLFLQLCSRLNKYGIALLQDSLITSTALHGMKEQKNERVM